MGTKNGTCVMAYVCMYMSERLPYFSGPILVLRNALL